MVWSQSDTKPYSLGITVQLIMDPNVSILPVERIIHPFYFVLSLFLTSTENVHGTCDNKGKEKKNVLGKTSSQRSSGMASKRRRVEKNFYAI